MVSTFTPNLQIEEPARGDQVGTWDIPVNSNMTLFDKVLGAVTTISLNNSNVVLSAAQFQSKTIVFNSTLTASVIITFPTSFIKSYEILNLCTGSSAFTVTLNTTAIGAAAVCAPPGEGVHIINNSGSMVYTSLPHVGTYWDYAGSSVPNWVSGCTVPPYLNCDGTAFSSATYPILANALGGTTLPDSKGRSRFALDQAAGRLSSAIAGFNPNVVGSAGGNQNYQQHNHNLTVTDPGHAHTYQAANYAINQWNPGGGASNTTYSASAILTASAITNITVASSAAGTGTSGNVPPAYIGGLTLIRSA